jgi:beta-phosphoglucomutase-like phosphatase (HAD superfamily)
MLEVDAHAILDVIERLHEAKTRIYEAMVAGGMVALRPGVLALMEEARRRGVQLAIATTTSPVNVTALMRRAVGPQWRVYVPVVCDGASAPCKKPHPLVYLQALEGLRLPAPACIAFEDSANGLRAALAAGLDTVVTPTLFTQDHDFAGALRVLPSLAGVSVDQLAYWRAEQAVGAAT